MTDPISVVTTAALTEAVRLLTMQGQKLLQMLKAGKRVSPEEIVSSVLDGALVDVVPDLARVRLHESALEGLIARLRAQGSAEEADRDSRLEVLLLVDAMRSVIEEIYGCAWAFVWEGGRHSITGARVEGRAHAESVQGKLAGVRVRDLKSGEVRGDLSAHSVEPGGIAAAVDIDSLGA